MRELPSSMPWTEHSKKTSSPTLARESLGVARTRTLPMWNSEREGAIESQVHRLEERLRIGRKIVCSLFCVHMDGPKSLLSKVCMWLIIVFANLQTFSFHIIFSYIILYISLNF